MQQDIFKHFKKSIEVVTVADKPRGTMDSEPPTFSVEVDALIKRKHGMTSGGNDDELRESRTNFHFRPSSANYIEVGNYVLLDGSWRTIASIDIMQHPRTAKVYAIYAEVADDIVPTDDEPVWGRMLSA